MYTYRQGSEAMNAADACSHNGTGVRGKDPCLMLQALVIEQQRRYLQNRDEALKCKALVPPMVLQNMKEKAAKFQQTAEIKVEFASHSRSKARLFVNSQTFFRSIDIGVDPPTCECGAPDVDKFPCSCLVVVIYLSWFFAVMIKPSPGSSNTA